MVEKLMVRIKPRQEHAEAEDARKCVKLGYPSDHRKSKVAWYADNGLEIDAPSELNNVRTKGFGKGRSDLKSRERNLGKIEEEERSSRIAADRAPLSTRMRTDLCCLPCSAFLSKTTTAQSPAARSAATACRSQRGTRTATWCVSGD